MSIASALNNLNNDIEAAKTAITDKGGTAPNGTADLANSIGSIPSGAVDDVTVNGNSVVTDGVAEIDLSDFALKTDLDDLQKKITRTAVTLAAASWVNKTQTVTVQGILADESAQLIQPVPASASMAAYYDAGVLATGQAANSLTFSCEEVPTADLTVYIVITEVSANA